MQRSEAVGDIGGTLVEHGVKCVSASYVDTLNRTKEEQPPPGRSTCRVLFWNVHGYNNLLEGDVNLSQFDVIGIAETWREGSIKLPKILQSYSVIEQSAKRSFRKGRASGGLALLISSKFKAKIINRNNNFIFAHLTSYILEIVVGIAYISPGADFSSFLNLLDVTLKCVKELYSCPIVMLGDFNARVGTLNVIPPELVEETYLQPYRTSGDNITNKRGQELVEMMELNSFFLLNGCTVSDSPAKFTYVGSTGSSTIDLGWCNLAGIKVVEDFQVDYLVTGSDHFPIVATLMTEPQLPVPRDPQTAKNTSRVIRKEVVLNDEVTKKFTESMLMSPRVSINFDAPVNIIHNNLINAIKDSASKLGVLKNSNNKKAVARNSSKPWFDYECRQYKNKIRIKLTELKRNGFDSRTRAEYWNSRKQYMKLIKTKKKAYWVNVAEILSECRDPSSFWKNVNSVRRKHSTCSDLSCESWSQFYRGVFPIHITNELVFFDVLNPVLDCDIDPEEVKLAIAQSGSRKAPGLDGLPNEVFKCLPDNWILYLTVLFNKVLCSEVVPRSWSEIITVMLHKKGPKEAFENYRPIALLNTIIKIFTTILHKRLIVFCDGASIIPEAQSGFRSGRGCQDNIFCLMTLSQMFMARKKKLIGIFVDFKRAFDSVSHPLLWQKLYRLGISRKLICILNNIYSNAVMKIRVDNKYSEDIRITEGVLQGETLSPLLFNLFLSDIDSYFQEKGMHGIRVAPNKEIRVLMFADDLVILADSRTDARNKMNVLSSYCKDNKLHLNANKSKCLEFSTGRVKSKGIGIYHNETKIEFVKAYKYLGISFSRSSFFNLAATEVLSKCNLATSAVWSVLTALRVNSGNLRNKLFMALIQSVALYGAHIWGIGQMHVFDRVQTNFYKSIFNLPKGTPGFAIRLELGLEHIRYYILKQALNWLIALLEMNEDRYPKICFESLRRWDKDPSNKVRYNWFSLIKQVLISHNVNVDWSNLDSATLIHAKQNLLSQLQIALYARDLEAAASSNFSPFFNSLFAPFSASCLYSLKIPFQLVKACAQLRLSSNYVVRISLSKDNKLEIDPQAECALCWLRVKEDLFHVFVECPLYEYLRQAHIPEAAGRSRSDYHSLLDMFCERKVVGVVGFLRSVHRVRSERL